MPRIPQDEIERLKREVSVQRLVEARGVALKKHGENLIGLCPFHEDHEPSLVVTPSKNLWHCLGACQAGGDVIAWVMKERGIPFRYAVDLLRKEHFGLGPSGPDSVSFPSDPGTDDTALLGAVIRFYHETLKESPEAQAYLAKRGFPPGEATAAMVERFRLGCANRTLGYRLPFAREKGGEIRERLIELGIFRSSGRGYEHFAYSLVIPIFDEEGRVIQAYGRKMISYLRPGTTHHLYLPRPLQGVWNLEALRASKEIILCEALIDALTFWHAGYRNVTASYGIEGFTPDHLAAFKSHGTERILIAYDRDDAGERAAAKLAEKLMAEGMECFRIVFPAGMDANEFALKETPAVESLGGVIRNAVWMGKGKPPAVSPLSVARCPLPESDGGPPGRTSLHEPRTTNHEPTPSAASDSFIPPFQGGSEGGEPPSGESSSNGRAAIEAPEPNLPRPLLGKEGGRGEAGEAAKEKAALPLAASESVDGAVSASPVPSAPKVEIPTEVRQEEVVITLGDRRYRIRGLAKNQSYDLLKVNLLVGCGESFHVDTLDLYSARQRAAFMKQASEEIGVNEDVLKKDMGKVLQKLESLQDEAIKKTLEPKEPTAVKLSDEERAAALDLLNDPNLLDRILRDFERCGVVGEETNKLMGYLAAVSRKLSEPLAVIIQSSSSAGKSALMEAILAFIPEEERIKYSAMTGQSLFYMEGVNLKHKVLAIVEEEGVEKASYALKLLQSEGELTIASTGKDPETGKLVTHEYRVEGPVMIFLTTTAIEIDEELLNRALVLTVNEDREQTRAIHRLQRERHTLQGLMARSDQARILKVHRDAQRLLRPFKVVIPHARELTFLDDRTRTRRDHVKYLTLIQSIALLHQRQRPVKRLPLVEGAAPAAPSGPLSPHGERVGVRGTPPSVPAPIEYIEATLADLDMANRLAHEVLGRSLDELPPQTRRFLLLLDQMAAQACAARKIGRPDYRFTRKDARDDSGWTYDQVHAHIERLVKMEYVLVHRGGRGQSFEYELLYDGRGKDGAPFVMGLIDVELLRKREAVNTTGSLGGLEGEFGGSFGAHLSAICPPFGTSKISGTNGSLGTSVKTSEIPSKNTYRAVEEKAVVVR